MQVKQVKTAIVYYNGKGETYKEKKAKQYTFLYSQNKYSVKVGNQYQKHQNTIF